MALETPVTFINTLNALNPAEGDQASDGDNHLRNIKGAIKATFPSITGAVTSTHTELNKLDGVTATTAELQKLAGMTATTAQMNFLVGVTSAIQTQLNTLSASITASAAVTEGTIVMTAGSTADAGYLLCQGQAIARTGTYAPLYARIGTAFGAGNGSTTFNIPDMRGVVPRGVDAGRGLDASRTLGSFQDDQFETHIHTASSNSTGAHTHGVTDPGHSHTVDFGGTSNGSSNADVTRNNITDKTTSASTTGITIQSAGAHSHTITIGAPSTGSRGSETRMKNTAVHFQIKY